MEGGGGGGLKAVTGRADSKKIDDCARFQETTMLGKLEMKKERFVKT